MIYVVGFIQLNFSFVIDCMGVMSNDQMFYSVVMFIFSLMVVSGIVWVDNMFNIIISSVIDFDNWEVVVIFCVMVNSGVIEICNWVIVVYVDGSVFINEMVMSVGVLVLSVVKSVDSFYVKVMLFDLVNSIVLVLMFQQVVYIIIVINIGMVMVNNVKVMDMFFIGMNFVFVILVCLISIDVKGVMIYGMVSVLSSLIVVFNLIFDVGFLFVIELGYLVQFWVMVMLSVMFNSNQVVYLNMVWLSVILVVEVMLVQVRMDVIYICLFKQVYNVGSNLLVEVLQ